MDPARKRIWGWYFFDWASQPYSTLLLTFIFGPYFAEVARGYFMGAGLDTERAAAEAQSFWGWGLMAASLLIALLAPVLGAVADSTGRRLVWIWAFSICYVVGATALWWVAPGGGIGLLWWAVFFFGLGFVGMEFATIFTNALMPSLCSYDEMGEVSGTGFAFGYLGGLAAMAFMLLFLAEGADGSTTLLGQTPLFGLDPEAREGTRAVGPFTAIWYVVFMIPFFLWVKEPRGTGSRLSFLRSLGQLKALLVSLRRRGSLSAYLLSSLFYRDALNALYAFGGVYASGVLNWSILKIGVFGLIGAIAAVLASWIGGKIDRNLGPKPVIVFSLAILTLVCVILVGMSRDGIWGIAFSPASNAPDIIFFICGGVIGAAGGSLQASSRTLMVRHTDDADATKAFSLYALSGKVTSFIGPALIAMATDMSNSQQLGISPLILLFLLGLFLLLWVHPQGEQIR